MVLDKQNRRSATDHTGSAFLLFGQVSSERAELARRVHEQQAQLEEEEHSKRKLRKKLSRRLEEAEREVAHLRQKLDEK